MMCHRRGTCPGRRRRARFSCRLRSSTTLLALLLAACGCSDIPVGPGGSVSENVADDIAVQAAAGLAVIRIDFQAAAGSTPRAANRSARLRPARAMSDTNFTSGGLTYQVSRTFYDGFDIPLPAYGPTAVRLRWTSRASGTLQGVRDTAMVGHAAVLDVRGIQSSQDTLRIDGTSTDTLFNRFRPLEGPGIRYFYWKSSMVVSQIRIPKSSIPAGALPSRGTVTFTVEADRLRSNDIADVEARFSATVVFGFDGTNQASLIVDGRYLYHLNLDTGEVTRG